MVGNLVTQLRTYSVGVRVDDWILECYLDLAFLACERRASFRP
jgi:hypothetical protein